ncbi:MAG TPA: 2Fe-2S iron-sulfur cluster-binding protein [Acidimicrobiales bacterium]|nr:2Fe-2S iron-sulfur cluster-binding protein [Acidimicrobiales bacterium]
MGSRETETTHVGPAARTDQGGRAAPTPGGGPDGSPTAPDAAAGSRGVGEAGEARGGEGGDQAGGEAATYQVTFHLPDGAVATVPARNDEHVLDAARRGGLDLPSRCEQGWDLVCAVGLQGGEVDHSDALRYYEADRAAGFALICTARACSDLDVVTHRAEAMRAERRRQGLPTPRG